MLVSLLTDNPGSELVLSGIVAYVRLVNITAKHIKKTLPEKSG